MIKEFTHEDAKGCKMDVFMKDGRCFSRCDMISFISTSFTPSDRLVAFWHKESVCLVPMANVSEIYIYKDNDQQP